MMRIRHCAIKRALSQTIAHDMHDHQRGKSPSARRYRMAPHLE
jgi:hypothetical protein